MLGYYCMTKEKPRNKFLRWSIIMSWDMLGFWLCYWYITTQLLNLEIQLFINMFFPILTILTINIVRRLNRHRLKNIEAHCQNE